MFVVGGLSIDVHVACDNRISLYPAAPFGLATLLHARTIAQEGRGSSLTRQTGRARSANPHNSHTSDPPNAPKGSVGTVDGSTPPVLLPVREHGTLRHEALFKKAPQRDRQFARNCNDHDPSDTPAVPCSSLHKPAGDRTLWLVLEPGPSRLDYRPAHLASPGSRDPLRSLHISAVVRTRCKTEKAGHLSPVVELTIVDLACHDGSNSRSDPGQAHQLNSLLLGDLAGRRRLVALAFERYNLLLYERQPRDLPSDLAGKSWRQWTPLSSDQLIDLQGLVLTLHVDAANALTEQQALDSIDVSRPFTDQAVALAVRAPEILFVDTGNANHRPDVALAMVPCDQCPQQHADIKPIRLCSARAPVHLHAGRVDHSTFNAACPQEPRPP